MSRWFIEASGQIEGPFTTEMIQSRLQAGTIQPTDKVWGRAMDEWRTLSWWSLSLKELSKYEQIIAHPEVWHYGFSGTTHGPMSWDDMINNLKMVCSQSMDQFVQTMVWTKGMKEWAPVMEFHEILDAVGLNKRESPRGEVQGKAIIKSLGNVYVSPLRHVGEGGFGCDAIPGLMAGETVTIELQSDSFKTAVHAKAQIRYMTDRLAGFKFLQVNVESRAAIVEHVRRSGGSQRYFVKNAA